MFLITFLCLVGQKQLCRGERIVLFAFVWNSTFRQNSAVKKPLRTSNSGSLVPSSSAAMTSASSGSALSASVSDLRSPESLRRPVPAIEKTLSDSTVVRTPVRTSASLPKVEKVRKRDCFLFVLLIWKQGGRLFWRRARRRRRRVDAGLFEHRPGKREGQEAGQNVQTKGPVFQKGEDRGAEAGARQVGPVFQPQSNQR
jgi:hypothetical protein